MPPDRRKPRPAGDGRGSLKIIGVDNNDGSELSPQTPKNQAFLRRRSSFARNAVYAEFGYRNARAIEYGAFVDRKPGPASRRWRSAQ